MHNRLFLHIGGEKTGTTALQHFLTQNARQLRRVGFHYPCKATDICFDRSAHFPIAASLMNKKAEFVSEAKQRTLPLVLEAVRQTIAGAKGTVLLSCEHFSSRLTLERQLASLHHALPVDDVKVIYYIREPSDLALAAWSTAVRAGARYRFEAVSITPKNRYYNPLETLALWGSVFGESNLIVREYNRSRLIDGDIRKDFCALLGIKPDSLHFDGEEKNESFDVQSLEVLRHINCILPEFHESEKGWRKAQHIRQLIAPSVPKGASLKTLLNEQERTLIKSRFCNIHREINERYFAGRLSPDWFPDSSALRPKPTLQSPTDIDLASALRETVICMAEANSGIRIKKSMKGKAKHLLEKLRQSLLRRVV